MVGVESVNDKDGDCNNYECKNCFVTVLWLAALEVGSYFVNRFLNLISRFLGSEVAPQILCFQTDCVTSLPSLWMNNILSVVW